MFSDRLAERVPGHLLLARAIDTRMSMDPEWAGRELLDWYRDLLLARVGAGLVDRPFDLILNDLQSGVVSLLSKLTSTDLQNHEVQRIACALFHAVDLPLDATIMTTDAQ